MKALNPGALAAGLLAAVAAGTAWAQPALQVPTLAASAPVAGLDVGAERERIATERKRIEALKSQQEAECRRRFAVTSCLNEVKARWRDPLTDLKRQDNVLNDVDRKRRSEQQRLKLDEREGPEARTAAERKRQEALEDQRERQERAASKAGGPKPAGTPRAASSQPASGPALSADQAASNAQKFQQRVDDAQAHKREMLRRQAERSKPAASALPVPR